MQRSSKNGKRCLTVSLAAMIAFSAMAASIMSGCGCDDKTGTSTGDETKVIHETQIVTRVETYTEVVVDDEGNTKYVEATRYVIADDSDVSNAGGSSAASTGSNNASSAQAAEKSESSASSSSNGGEKSESSAASASSSSSSSNGSEKSESSASSSSKAGKSSDENSGKLALGGSSFNVGDTVVCTYDLTAPQVLENYQAYITYDTDKLECTSAKMSDAAKSGSLLNYNTQGKIYITGSNIGSGYNFTEGGTFLTVTYTVKSGGSASPTFNWEVASNKSSQNLISNGTPASGFTLSVSYSKG